MQQIQESVFTMAVLIPMHVIMIHLLTLMTIHVHTKCADYVKINLSPLHILQLHVWKLLRHHVTANWAQLQCHGLLTVNLAQRLFTEVYTL